MTMLTKAEEYRARAEECEQWAQETQRAPASGLFPGVSPEPVEDVGEVVAGPAFGDLVADDMIDMNSFGVNLEPCRRDVVIGSKVRRAQAPARHHLVILAKHVFDGHVPIGQRHAQAPNENLHGGQTFPRLEPSRKTYEIVGKDIVELVERARVGSVMLAIKQFERLLIVHLPLLQLPQSLILALCRDVRKQCL